MKAKALRTKTEPKEFVQVANFMGSNYVCTSIIPHLMSEEATIKGLVDYYNGLTPPADISEFEIVELDIIDCGVVGADIRNKLSSPTNLLALLKLYFEETDADRIRTLEKFIKKEMKQSEKSIKYISNLL